MKRVFGIITIMLFAFTASTTVMANDVDEACEGLAQIYAGLDELIKVVPGLSGEQMEEIDDDLGEVVDALEELDNALAEEGVNDFGLSAAVNNMSDAYENYNKPKFVNALKAAKRSIDKIGSKNCN